MQSEARVKTEQPSRYLQQLCKHFEHKLTVAYTKEEGSIAFSAGTCRLYAEPGVLRMVAEAVDAEGLARVEDVTARHLVRFAFREPPEVVWDRAAATV